MLADLEHLIELQQTDLRLHELTRQIALFPQRRAEAEGELARARDTLARHRSAHTDSLKQRKKLELDAQQFEERISKHKTQMYEVKTNDAYRALQHEVEGDEKLKAQAEDRVLEAMIAAEELEKAIKAAEAGLKEVERRVAARLREIEQEEAVEKEEAAGLTAQRDALRAQTNEEMLSVYDRIARGHGGIALAEARGEVCQVCLIHIRPQTYAEVKRNDQIHYCESCHRILYFVPAAPPPSGVEEPVGAGS